MFFSAARPRTASTISLDMDSFSGYEVGADDLLVGNRDHAVLRGDGDLPIRGADQLTGQLLVRALGQRRVTAEPHAGTPAEKARVVLGLGKGAVLTRRRDLERKALAVISQMARHPLEDSQRHAVWMVDVKAKD